MNAEAEIDAVPSDLISTRQASKRLKCARQTVVRMVAAGKLRGWQPTGAKLYVSEAEVEQRLRQSRVAPQAT